MPGAPPDILKKPENRFCADCGRGDPKWASVNLGIIICEVCCGIHRGIGVHITTVKSTTIDEWKPKWVETVRGVGNGVAKAYYEANVPESERYSTSVGLTGGDRIDNEDAKKLRKWIRAKYEEKKYAPKGVDEPWKRLERGEVLDGGGGGGKKEKKDKKEKKAKAEEVAPPPAPEPAAAKKEKKEKKSKDKKEAVEEPPPPAVAEGKKDKKTKKEKKHKKEADEDWNENWDGANAESWGPGYAGYEGAAAWNPQDSQGYGCGYGCADEGAYYDGSGGTEAWQAAVAYPYMESGAYGASTAWQGDAAAQQQYEQQGYGYGQEMESWGGPQPPAALQQWQQQQPQQQAEQDWQQQASQAWQQQPPPQQQQWQQAGGENWQQPQQPPVQNWQQDWQAQPGLQDWQQQPQPAMDMQIQQHQQQPVGQDWNQAQPQQMQQEENWQQPYPGQDWQQQQQLSQQAGYPTTYEEAASGWQQQGAVGPASSAPCSPEAFNATQACRAQPSPISAQTSPTMPKSSPMSMLGVGDNSGGFPMQAQFTPSPPQQSRTLAIDTAVASEVHSPQLPSGGAGEVFNQVKQELESLREEVVTLRRDCKEMTQVMKQAEVAASERRAIEAEAAAAIVPTTIAQAVATAAAPCTPRTPHTAMTAASAWSRTAATDAGESAIDQASLVSWTMTRQAFMGYTRVFRSVDRLQHGFLEGRLVKEILDKSTLPSQDLSRIWALADVHQCGRLSLEEFACAMHIATLRRSGSPIPDLLPRELWHTAVRFTSELQEGQKAQGAIQLARSPISASDFLKWTELFAATDTDGDGFITGAEARAIMEISQLPFEDLQQIWMLSDQDMDSCLTLAEFIVAMHLMSQRMQGGDLPQMLPTEVPRSVEELLATPPAQLLSQDAADSSYSVTRAQFQLYHELFKGTDRNHDGYVDSAEAGELLNQSGLPAVDLVQIWNLSDMDHDGRLSVVEFACAMHLIGLRRHGEELPPALPPSFEKDLTTHWVAMCEPKGAIADLPLMGPWRIGPVEYASYREQFRQADKNSDGLLERKEVIELLEDPDVTLRDVEQIWRMADVDRDGRMSLIEFACAMHMFGKRRRGGRLPVSLPVDLLHSAAELAAAPRQEGPTQGLAQPPIRPSGTGRRGRSSSRSHNHNSNSWSMDAYEFTIYLALFREADLNHDDFIEGREARRVMDKSLLPSEDLMHIWMLSDVDNDGRLSLVEFACAIHMVERRRRGGPLPSSMPPELVRAAADLATKLSPRRISVSRRPPKALPDAEAAVDYAAMEGLDASSSPWIPSSQDMVRYEELFLKLDIDGDGLVEGVDAKEVMEESMLSGDDLLLIWSLADFDEDGRLSKVEFACAMHLIAVRRQGLELPARVPDELLVAVQNPGSSSSLDGLAGIAPAMQQKFRQLYDRLAAKANSRGKVPAPDVFAILQRSRLPEAELDALWAMSGTDRYSPMSFPDFARLMHEVDRRRGMYH